MYEVALSVYREEDFPAHWAMTQNNLGIAYMRFTTGDRGENLRQAIGYFEAALRVRNEQDCPVDWARTQENLGIAYSNLPSGNRAENLHNAIQCYDNAIRGFRSTSLEKEGSTVITRIARLKSRS
jgi:tetratricopeptide (TPR) repeat protein